LQKLPTIAEVANNCKNCQQLQKLPIIAKIANNCRSYQQLQKLPTIAEIANNYRSCRLAAFAAVANISVNFFWVATLSCNLLSCNFLIAEPSLVINKKCYKEI